MLLLALDTSSAAVTAAVHDGVAVIGEHTLLGAQSHGELLAPVVRAALADAGAAPADLTQIVVGVGPGPFTGLRVGIVMGQVMGLALGIGVGGVCSLDALAWLARHHGTVAGPFAVATDARRKEVYLATYDAHGVRLTGPEVVLPGDMPEEVRNGQLVGAGAQLYRGLCLDVRGPQLVSGAAVASYAVAVLHAGYDLPAPTPLYLRQPDAVPSVGSKKVLS
jgi:tRNA threonylcarbamoyl adenosine modification protein YeaZ